MCGIAGALGWGTQPRDTIAATGMSMGNAILHRGPDGGGVWQDPAAEILLVHRRLAIIDLSSAGDQPMVSSSGRYIIVYNGEIYNHIDLRLALDAEGAMPEAGWVGHSDTETLLAAIEQWGLDEALSRTIGMFSIALWDREERSLSLARDRMGEKPLYYGWQGKTFLFASEIKALRAHPAFVGTIDRNALALQLRHNCVPAPYSIYQNISKLEPGCILRVWLDGRHSTGPVPYWRFADAVEHGLANPFQGSAAEAATVLEDLLIDVVGRQMVADVPVGAFLSGGIDSSTIVALMQARSAQPIHTFTIGFGEPNLDEAVHAKAVARYLGTNHTELYVTSQHALDVVPNLGRYFDEPFSDSSQIPTFLVSEMTQRHVSVSLSGDGGDELFGGYSRYYRCNRWWSSINRLPVGLRRIASGTLRGVDTKYWNALGRSIAPYTRTKHRWYNLGSNLHKVAGVLNARSGAELYHHFVSHWTDPSQVVIGAQELPTAVTHPPLELGDIVMQMMALDTVSYLPDDILTKVDRAAMAVSLETRIPFLDHRVVEFAWSMPLTMKVQGARGKLPLRQVLDRYVPQHLIERPKMGFGVPLNSWLRGPLRDWAEDLLSETRLRQQGFLRPEPIRRKWAEHLSGTHDWQYHIWDVLMFQSWLNNTAAS